MEDLAKLGLEATVAAMLGPRARMFVSEPIGKLADAWIEMPQASALRLRHGEVEVAPFRPAAQ